MKRVILLRPSSLVFFGILPFCVFCWLIPERIYLEYWETPKHLDLAALGLILLALIALGVGAFVGEVLGAQRQPRVALDPRAAAPAVSMVQLRRAFWIVCTLTLMGYALWIALLMRNGLSLGAMRDLLARKSMAMYEFREYSQFIPGVTTWMQAAPVALMVGAVLLAQLRRSEVVWVRRMCGLLLLMSAARAFFNSERLALLECVIPFLLVMMLMRWQFRWSRTLVRALIPLLILAVILVFFITELFRFWTNVGKNTGFGYFDFIGAHFIAYYATALNNGYLAYKTLGVTWGMSSVLNWLFAFPLVGGYVQGAYYNAIGYVGQSLQGDLLKVYANERYNNLSGIFPVIVDLGPLLGGGFFASMGVAAGLAWRRFCSFSLGGVLTFPVLFLCVVEIPRVFLLSSTRFFPTWLAIAIVYVVLQFGDRGGMKGR